MRGLILKADDLGLDLDPIYEALGYRQNNLPYFTNIYEDYHDAMLIKLTEKTKQMIEDELAMVNEGGSYYQPPPLKRGIVSEAGLYNYLMINHYAFLQQKNVMKNAPFQEVW